MAKHEPVHVFEPVDDKHVAAHEGAFQPENGPDNDGLHCYKLFLTFKQFRDNNQHKELIEFLVQKYPANVKNKTFNFVNTNHLFHSLYAYIPAVTNVEKERKQIRLSEECIHKLFLSTVNDFKLYTELFNLIRVNQMKEKCPCELLLRRREEIKTYVTMINEKKFDNKPPKLKKELIDNIMYKYSLNWKSLLLKRKVSTTATMALPPIDVEQENVDRLAKKKRKIKKRTILTDDYIYVEGLNASICKLHGITGVSLMTCAHDWIVEEKQLRAGDEAVSFIRYCRLCGQVN
ncbi:LEF5 [Orgyia pseudotsugata single capsid nuclopolyhedrovirus]|nr:LEF5 [Orgyia pseudotsugata single capsid nuclopolyhedrovirus]